MKRILSALLCGSLLLLSACGSGSKEAGGSKEEKETVKIGITQLVEHPSLDAAREGFIAALKDAGYEEGKNLKLDYQNAQGDMNNNMTIAQNLVADDNDLILAIRRTYGDCRTKWCRKKHPDKNIDGRNDSG